MIDLEFYEPKRRLLKQNSGFRRVRSAWQSYLAHLGSEYPKDKAQEPVYLNQRHELFIDLLYEMAMALGYDDFDKTEIRKLSYMPAWHTDIEQEQTIIRKGLANVMAGNAAIPMRVTEFPSTPAVPNLGVPPTTPSIASALE